MLGHGLFALLNGKTVECMAVHEHARIVAEGQRIVLPRVFRGDDALDGQVVFGRKRKVALVMRRDGMTTPVP